MGEGTLNTIEMAFRAYDPCYGWAARSLPGHMPLEVTVRSQASGAVISRATRNI